MLCNVDNLYSAVIINASRALYRHRYCKLNEKENKCVFMRRLNVFILLFS